MVLRGECSILFCFQKLDVLEDSMIIIVGKTTAMTQCTVTGYPIMQHLFYNPDDKRPPMLLHHSHDLRRRTASAPLV